LMSAFIKSGGRMRLFCPVFMFMRGMSGSMLPIFEVRQECEEGAANIQSRGRSEELKEMCR